MNVQGMILYLGTALCLFPGSATLSGQAASSEASAQAPQKNPSATSAQQTAQSRAEEWRERRRQKLGQITPNESSGLEKGLLYLEEKGLSELLIIRYKDFYPRFGNLSHGSGFAPGIRYDNTNLGRSPLSLEGSAAFSFTGYKLGHLQFGRYNKTAPHVFLGPANFGAPFKFAEGQPEDVKFFLYADLRYRYFPREIFYGLGRESKEEDRTDFLLEDGSYDVVAGYQPVHWFGAVVRAGYLQVNTGPGTDENFPDIGSVFDDASAAGLARQPDFLHLDSAVYFDYRDRPGNPHRGGVVGLSFSRFDDRGGREFEFNRFSADARGYLPLGSEQRVLAVRLFGSVDDADAGARVPFYLQNTLGGNETLRGFREFRFRDSNLLFLSAEYRWEAAPALEFAVFYDVGKTFPESEGFDFDHLEKSLGVGIRVKTSKRVFLRLDVGRGDEGTKIHFRFGPSF